MQGIVIALAGLLGIAAGDLRGACSLGPAAATLASTGAALCWRSRAWRTLALATGAAALGLWRVGFGPLAVPVPWPMIGAARQAAAASLHAALPEPQATLTAAVLFGGGGQLRPELRQQMQRAGLSHLVAIDGYKQVLVAAGVQPAAARLLGARGGALLSLCAVGGYTLLTGARPSAVRAALMLGMARLAALTGRPADPAGGLLMAALLMGWVDPPLLLDVGLQLSVAATLGILLLWPVIRRVMRRGGLVRTLPRWVIEPIGLTLAVTIACLPVTLRGFGLVSLVSPLAHIAAMPLVPMIVVSGLAVVFAAALPWSALGLAAAWAAWAPSTGLLLLVGVCGSLPGAALGTGRLAPGPAAALALGLLSWGIWHLPESVAARRAFAAWRAQQAPLVGLASRGWL